MKFSSKILKCQLSPVRKFNPCADQAVAAGRTIYHLNIGQPDVKTPESFYQAIAFRQAQLFIHNNRISAERAFHCYF